MNGTKDNSRLVTIHMTQAAITQGTTFNIYYAVFFEDRSYYDMDTADLTPHLTLDGEADSAIGEELRVTIAARSVFGFQPSNNAAAWHSATPGFLDDLAQNDGMCGWSSRTNTTTWSKIGLSRYVTFTPVIYGIDNITAIAHMNYTGEYIRDAKVTMRLPAGIEIDPTLAINSSFVIDTSGTDTIISYEFAGLVLSGLGSFPIKYVAPPANGQYYQFITTTEGISFDGLTTKSSTGIYRDYYSPNPLTASMGRGGYTGNRSVFAKPGVDGNDGVGWLSTHSLSALALGDPFGSFVQVGNNGQVSLKEAQGRVNINGNMTDILGLSINTQATNNVYPMSISLPALLDTLTINYSNGHNYTVQFSDATKFNTNTIYGHNSIQTITKDDNPFSNWGMNGEPADVYITSLEFKAKAIFQVGWAVLLGVDLRLRDTLRTGGPVIPGTHTFGSSNYAQAKVNVVDGEILSGSSALWETPIYATTEDILRQTTTDQGQTELGSVLAGGQTFTQTKSIRASINDYYNAVVKKPGLYLMVPEYLTLNPASISVVRKTGWAPGIPPALLGGIALTSTALTKGVDYTVTHSFRGTPGVNGANVYKIQYNGDLRHMKNHTLEVKYSFSIPAEARARDDAWIRSTVLFENITTGALVNGTHQGSWLQDEYDLDDDGNTTEYFGMIGNKFRILEPNIFSTNNNAIGDIDNTWVADAFNFAEVSKDNLARVKDTGTLRYRMVNGTGVENEGDAFFRLPNGSFKPTLSGITLLDIVDDVITTRSSIDGLHYSTHDALNPRDIGTDDWVAVDDVDEIPDDATWILLDDLVVDAHATLGIRTHYNMPKNAKFGDVARGIGFTDINGVDNFSNYAGFMIGTSNITYTLNGGTNPDAQIKTYIEADTDGKTLAILNPKPRYGYIFLGWTAAYSLPEMSDHSTTQPAVDYELTAGAIGDLHLTANWQKDPSINFHITYDGNGHTEGTAPVDMNIYLIDDEATIAGKGDLAKTGWTFLGWSTVPTATATDFAENDDLVLYSAGDELTMTEELTLYAIWDEDETTPTPPTDPEKPDKPSKPENPGTTDPTKPGNGNGENTDNGNNGAGIVDSSSNNSTNGGNSNRGNGATNTEGNGVGARTARPNENGTTEPTDNPNTDPATITDPNTPLSSGTEGNWSLLSLILGIASVLISLMFMLIRRRKDEDEQTYANGLYGDNTTDDARRHGRILKLVAVLLGIVPIALFLILDRITEAMVFINDWTVFVAIAFVAHCITTVIAKTRQDKETENSYNYMG
jgi:hypothetical protein